jgi:hypothetical protein
MDSFSPLTPSGGAAPYTFSITAGTLPKGLSLDANTGAVTGTPTEPYVAANVDFLVKDANGLAATTTSSVIFSVSPSITATKTNTTRNLIVGTAMDSFSPLTPSGGVAPYTYSYTGTLPGGLNFDASTGAVTGTPTAIYAAANLIFSVKDANKVVAATTNTVSFSVAMPDGYVSQGGLTWMPLSAMPYNYDGAATLCSEPILGLTGWRLPDGRELNSLYVSGAMNGKWTSYYVWSSWSDSTFGSSNHFRLCWLDGNEYVDIDTDSNNVTCVR